VNVLLTWSPPLLLAGVSLWIFERFYLRTSLLYRKQTGSHSLKEMAEIIYPKKSRFSTWWAKLFPPKMMPMHEAVRHIYDQIHDTELGLFIRRNFDDVEKQLRCLAEYIVGTSVPIFGKRPSGASLKNVGKEMFKKGSFYSSGDSFSPHGTMGIPTLTDISIYRSDLQKAIGEIIALGVTVADVEREFGNAFDRAAAEHTKPTKDAALLRLAQLRSQGIALRNESAQLMFTSHLDAWSSKIIDWMNEVTEAIKPVSEADSIWFGTLGEVPEPRVPIPNLRLGGDADRTMFISTFRQHDFRLKRLDDLLKKNGIGA
jgi:hypothetical protein